MRKHSVHTGISVPFDYHEISNASLVFFDGKLNIILGNDNDKHYEWILNKKYVNKYINLKCIHMVYRSYIDSFRKREMLWLIGGFDCILKICLV